MYLKFMKMGQTLQKLKSVKSNENKEMHRNQLLGDSQSWAIKAESSERKDCLLQDHSQKTGPGTKRREGIDLSPTDQTRLPRESVVGLKFAVSYTRSLIILLWEMKCDVWGKMCYIVIILKL